MHVEDPIRVTFSTFTIVDHIATTCARNIVNSGVHKISLSDHYLVYCTRKYNGAVEIGNEIIKTYKMKNFSVDAFGLFSGMPLEQMLTETDDINVVYHWSILFSRIIDKHAPIREMYL